MNNTGVHDFAIPHEHVQPTRDMVIIQLPMPPKRSNAGTIIIPDMFRDMAQHNVAAGRVVSMGPLAFTYKNMDGNLDRQDVKIGDWVMIRPYAGTLVQGGKLQMSGGYRYVSSFADVIGIVPADRMPTPETLLWDETEEAPAAPKPAPEFGGKSREVIKAGS